MKIHKIKITVALIALGAVYFLFFPPTTSAGQTIPIIQLNDDTINPITSEYITKAIDRAELKQAPCLIIKLDTPGGLLNSTRSIVKRMLTSKVPLVVYISPSGAHAGSAGVFITYASHIAAMAPTTNIGAAHPIQYGKEKPQEAENWGELKDLLNEIKKSKEQEKDTQADKVSNDKTKEKSDQKTDDKISADAPKKEEKHKPDEHALESKLLNDTVAFIKGIAKERNRNVEWAVQSVVESQSITEAEAVEKGVVEIIAKDDLDLVAKLDGKTVLIDGRQITLNTKDAQLEYIPMDHRQKFFNIIANPDIAYFLLILGFYGLLYEITHPGLIMPGVLGAIGMILGFYSMQTLPVNYAGLSLVFIGLMLLVAEIFVPGIGALAFGGILSLVIGSFLLFDSVDPVMRVSIQSIIGVSGTATLLAMILVSLVYKSRNAKMISGKEGIVGEIGIVQHEIKAGAPGKVEIQGELWNAESKEEIKPGEKVQIVKVVGLTLHVIKVREE